ncbi:sperm-associated antigen 4 protein-like isoform 3-T3 [Ara ararauna]
MLQLVSGAGPRCSWGSCMERVHHRNTPDVWKGQAGEMQQLRDEVTYLAAEIRSMKKEGQQMREAMSDPMDVSDWALRSTGTAIDLQEASSTSARLRRMFWFLFSQPFEDTFVQPDASPGYCWLMQQPQSEVLIRLPTEVQPTAITLQHCSKIATPLGTVSSAPKDFTASVSLCWARGWDLTTGKAVTRTCCSLCICGDVCAPRHCPSPRGHLTDLLRTFWPSTSRALRRKHSPMGLPLCQTAPQVQECGAHHGPRSGMSMCSWSA